MSTLRLNSLNKTYPNGQWAVRDVDLTIDDGELFVIVCPSGGGKTTLLRMVAVMNGGRIVQCGRPIDVYEAPDNLFVGQFIGAPAMNVIAATVVVDGGAPAIRIGHQDVPLDDETLRRLPALSELTGRQVALGIRPDAIHPDACGPLALSVMATELIDRRRHVFVDVDAPSITCRDDHVVVDRGRESRLVLSVDLRTPVSLWESFRASIDLARIHLFDLATGRRLRATRADRP
jgi:multiple sugar transport system ATP-binding protein